MGEKLVTGNSDLIRQVNRALVMDLIRRHGPISRADLKRMTGLNFTTVTNVVNDLISEGFVREAGRGTSRGGRKPVLLTHNPTARYVLGCKLQSTELAVGLFDLDGNLVVKVEEPKLPSTPPGEVVERIQRGVKRVLEEAGVPPGKVEGLGCAAPGPLDSRAGVLLTPPNMIGWRNVPLKAMLEDACQLPIVVENDGNAAAVGEAWFGAGRDVRNLIAIIVDDGIGGGIIANGRLYRGSWGGAGEIGHTTIDIDGPRCSCGNYGCLEAIASGFALSRKAQEAIRRGVRTLLADSEESGIGVPEILKAARAGDKLALDLLDECGRILGIAVANVVNMYNPDLIVLCGRLAESPLVLERAIELGRSRAFSVLSESVRIVRSALGEEFLAAGAAALVLARLVRSPVELTPLEA